MEGGGVGRGGGAAAEKSRVGVWGCFGCRGLQGGWGLGGAGRGGTGRGGKGGGARGHDISYGNGEGRTLYLPGKLVLFCDRKFNNLYKNWADA